MKRLTPMLTLLTGTGMAAVLFTMSAQAAPPAARTRTGAEAAATVPASPSAPPPSAEAAPPVTEAPPASEAPPSAAPTAPPAAPSTGAPAETVTASWTGRLDNGATIAITARDGRAVAYVCDGRKLEIWLKGTAAAGRLALTGKKGATLTGTFGNGRASGALVAGGKRWTFTAKASAEPAPVLYRATARVRDAGVDGGWILLPDGTQIGVVTWDGSPMPAPKLDPAFGTTIVGGVSITAEAVAPDPGAGE